MEGRTQRQAVCKHQQNFKQSWAKEGKINRSLGKSYHRSPGEAFSERVCRCFHEAGSLLSSVRPKRETGGLSRAQRVGTSGWAGGDQSRTWGRFSTTQIHKGSWE